MAVSDSQIMNVFSESLSETIIIKVGNRDPDGSGEATSGFGFDCFFRYYRNRNNQ